jgi:hypothetical protein
MVKYLLALLLLLLGAGVLLAQDEALPPVDFGAAGDIPQAVSVDGFPALGTAGARVEVVALCAYGDLACAAFQQDVFPALLPLIAEGEVAYTFVPLASLGTLDNGRGAARAALCAGEFTSFWSLNTALVDAALTNDAPFEPAALREHAEAVGLDTDIWQECLLSDRPDRILESAEDYAATQLAFDGATLPYVTVNGVASLPNAEAILAAITEVLDQPEATPDPEATEPPLVVTVEPLLGERIPPPFEIALPDGWQFGYDTFILSDVDGAIRTIPLAVYTGPIPGGSGTIVLLWGFPNLFGAEMFSGGPNTPDLWSDGLRLLRLAIIEQDCNIGTDLRREYSIGGMSAAGTQFSAVDCPELPDTRGWFAGVQESGVNFVFFMFADPIDAMTTGQEALQAVLDSVEFHVEPAVEVTATPAP